MNSELRIGFCKELNKQTAAIAYQMKAVAAVAMDFTELTIAGYECTASFNYTPSINRKRFYFFPFVIRNS